MDGKERTNLDLRFLVRRFLRRLLELFVVSLVRDIDTNTKLIAKLVNARALRTNDTTNILPLNFKLGKLEGKLVLITERSGTRRT